VESGVQFQRIAQFKDAPQPEAVQPFSGFNLDDLSAMVGHDVTEYRAGPDPTEIDNANACER
jgi:hypothetical protein